MVRGGLEAAAGRVRVKIPNLRGREMPSERLIDALNEQIGNEFAAAHQYVAIGVYYEGETFPRLAHFFYEQAEDEREHAMKMVRYLLDSNSPVRMREVGSPTDEFSDHVAPIELALEQEKRVTVQIGKLVDVARETNDHASERFLDWFVDEQVEEEAKMQDLLAVAERTREIPVLLEEYLARDKPGRHVDD
jgi:ferritin